MVVGGISCNILHTPSITDSIEEWKGVVQVKLGSKEIIRVLL
jgi:hypothetical protein